MNYPNSSQYGIFNVILLMSYIVVHKLKNVTLEVTPEESSVPAPESMDVPQQVEVIQADEVIHTSVPVRVSLSVTHVYSTQSSLASHLPSLLQRISTANQVYLF